MNFISGKCYQVVFGNGILKTGVVIKEDDEWMLFSVDGCYDLDEGFIRDSFITNNDDVRRMVEDEKQHLWNREYYLDDSILDNIIDD